MLAIVASGSWVAGRPLAAQVPDSARADTVPIYRNAELEVSVTRNRSALFRLPFGITAVGPRRIRDGQRMSSLDESLRFVPGFFVQNRRNYSLGDRLTARGVGARAQFGVRGLRVLADGIPLTLADGQSTISNLDITSAGRVEVMRGPAAALYGNSASGVVSVRTATPPAVAARLEPTVVAGSYGFFQTRLGVAGRPGGVGYVTNLSFQHSTGFRDYASADLWRANLVASGPVGAGTLRGVLNIFHTPFAENPSSLDEEVARNEPRTVRSFIISQGAGERATQGQAGLTLDLPLGGRTELAASVWGLGRDLWNPIPGRIIQIDRFAGGLRSELRGAIGSGSNVRWLGGVDLELQNDHRVESDNLGVPEGGDEAEAGDVLQDQRERVIGLGPFLQLEVGLGEQWILTLAGRLDVYDFDVDDRLTSDGDDSSSRTLSQFNPAAGVVFLPSPDVQLYGNFATAFQTPTTSELSNRPDGSGGFNEGLEPERIRSLEAGVRASLPGPRLALDVAGFFAGVNDALVPRQAPDEEVFFVNAGRIERSGLEISVAWEPVERVVADLSYTAQRLRFDEFVTPAGDFSGNREPGVPEQWLVLGLRHLAAFGLTSEVLFRWVDAFAVDDANTASNWSSTVFDLRFSLDRSGQRLPLRAFIGVDNLFGVRYNASVVPNAFGGRYYEPAPGIEVYGGVSLPFRVGGAP